MAAFVSMATSNWKEHTKMFGAQEQWTAYWEHLEWNWLWVPCSHEVWHIAIYL